VAYDYLIVGAGFAGSVCARQLADAGKRVLIIDKRDHIGGNAYDYVNEHGVRIHKYGPHIFHTNSDKVFAYLSRFTEWRPYEHRVLASLEGNLVPFPVNLTTLEMLGLEHLKPPPETGLSPANAEEQCLQRVGPELYELFFKGYTTKMWGRAPRELDASVTARIPVRWDSRDDRYFTDKHQAMPNDGYTAMFERMLDNPKIEVAKRVPALGLEPQTRHWLQTQGIPSVHFWLGERVGHTIWTGPIDEYFGHCFGPLPYRSMRFEEGGAYLPCHYRPYAPVVNWCSAEGATRSTDMAWLSGVGEPHWLYIHEHPTAEGEPFYPIPSPENKALYKRYEELAARETNVTFLGRLGRYQYLNMDQVVGQALMTAERLLGANPARV
jgi:UDP-galactopyranose mutase